MPSLLPGYEYDIFISYRHNDNLDGWVTDFVQHLEKELRGTVKYTVTIYFDKNPDDGLLETHSVDRSLEGKLRCLIFIPIVSQTYCDPKSFAWQHEFCAFNKLAKEDQFGRDIKLGNGNVASRILPIKIHDLDAEDKYLLESELNGVLRAIEFTYKEAGVNRPLQSSEENPAKNQNQTVYRNQVNKVSNSIKEIITAINNPTSQPITSNQPPAYPEDMAGRLTTNPYRNRRLLLGSLALLFLLAISYFFYEQRSTGEQPIALDKSIAVLPFADMSSDKNLEYLGDGIAEEIINVLTQSKDLKVIARSSSFQFKGKNEDLRTIGKVLGVSTILEGSVRKFKDQIRVTAQLINVKDGSHYWSKNYDQNTDNIFVIQDGIAAHVAAALRVTWLEGKAKASRIPWDEEAQRLYQQGRYFYDRADDSSAHELFERSVALDPKHAISQTYLAANSANLGDSAASRLHARIALELDPSLTEAHAHNAVANLYRLDFDKAWKEIDIALQNGVSNPLTLRSAAIIYQIHGQSVQAIAFAKKAVELDPLVKRSSFLLANAYYFDRNYLEAISTINQGNDPEELAFTKVLCLLKLEKFKEAENRIKKIKDTEERDFLILFLAAYKGDVDNAQLRKRGYKYHNSTLSYQSVMLLANGGDPDEAMDYLDQLVLSKHIFVCFASIDPMLDPLRKNPRFIKLIEKLNFPRTR